MPGATQGGVWAYDSGGGLYTIPDVTPGIGNGGAGGGWLSGGTGSWLSPQDGSLHLTHPVDVHDCVPDG